MKIGVDVRSLLDKEPSGVGEYTYNLLVNLIRQDKQNEYVLFYNIFRSGQDEFILNNFKDKYPNVKIKSFNWPNKFFDFCLKFFKYPKLDKLIGEVDIFFSPNLHYTALSKTVKHVVTVHDVSFKIYPDMFSFRKKVWHSILGVNPKKFFTQADLLLAVSNNTKRDLINFYHIDPERIAVTYLAAGKLFKDFQAQVPSKQLANRLVEVRKKYDLANNYILSLSTLEPRKNIVSLIRAFDNLKQDEQLASLELVIAGGKGWCYQDIYAAANESPNKNQIKFLGYIKNRDKPYLYHLADILAWPSFYEGFGIPPLESMACGTPVVTSTASSLPEVVKDAAVLVSPFDVGEIAAGLKLVLENKKFKQVLINRGFVRINELSWQETSKNTLSIFNQ